MTHDIKNEEMDGLVANIGILLWKANSSSAVALLHHCFLVFC